MKGMPVTVNLDEKKNTPQLGCNQVSGAEDRSIKYKRDCGSISLSSIQLLDIFNMVDVAVIDH
jgi:hypothetical protein